jgi:hypothetical protein
LGSGICDNHPGSATLFTHARIRIKLFALVRIWFQLFTSMQIRNGIQLNILMRIGIQIQLYTLMRIRIKIQLFTLMRIQIRIHLFLLMRIRIMLLIKRMGIACSLTWHPWTA